MRIKYFRKIELQKKYFLYKVNSIQLTDEIAREYAHNSFRLKIILHIFPNVIISIQILCENEFIERLVDLENKVKKINGLYTLVNFKKVSI